MSAIAESATMELELIRVYDAPRALVFEAWTDGEVIAKWGCPNGLTFVSGELDARPGGVMNCTMREANGTDHVERGTFKEVTEPSRIVFTHAWETEVEGVLTPETLVTVTFEETEGRTRMTFTQAGFPSVEFRDGHREGWGEAFDKLAGVLADEESFVISRTYNASREKLWRALTEPSEMGKWWGPAGVSTNVKRQELRPGGITHYSMVSQDGGEFWGKFTYRKIDEPERLEFLNSFSDAEGGIARHPLSPKWPAVMLSVFSLDADEERTTFTIKWTPYEASAEEIETFKAAREGMKDGWGGSLDKLGEYLAGN